MTSRERTRDWLRASPRSLSQVDTSEDEVIVVDANDVAIGTAPKLEAHRRGLSHRAISVFVGDPRGSLLLQQRSAGKYHSGGLWTNTCCSHPRPGEDVHDAAMRRLDEEMGIACPLVFLFSMHYRANVSNELIEDEIVHVFGGRFSGVPNPNPLEVSDWVWRPSADIARDIDQRPDRYTIWFRKFHREYWSLINRNLRDLPE